MAIVKNVQITRGNESTMPPSNTAHQGELKYALDTGRLFIDTGISNVLVSDPALLQLHEEKLNAPARAAKFYTTARLSTDFGIMTPVDVSTLTSMQPGMTPIVGDVVTDSYGTMAQVCTVPDGGTIINTHSFYKTSVESVDAGTF